MLTLALLPQAHITQLEASAESHTALLLGMDYLVNISYVDVSVCAVFVSWCACFCGVCGVCVGGGAQSVQMSEQTAWLS
jgi:hypothetical protein